MSLNTSDETEEVVSIKPLKKHNKFVAHLRSMFIWYPANYDAKEKKLMVKLDITILAYTCLVSFVSHLDSGNISNAYVSGMKEDLNLYGNQLNWLNVSFTMGAVIAQIPLLLLSSRASLAPYVLPSMQILFGVLTFCQSQVKTVKQLYAVRFFCGFFDGPVYITVHYVLGRWFGTKSFRGNPSELFVRTGVYFGSTQLGSIVSAYLQIAAYKNLSGVHGYKGWQWLFIIDGIFTIPIAILGFIFFPGLPDSPKVWWFTDEEYAIADKRRERYKITKSGDLNWDVVKRTFKNWPVYLFVTSYTAMLLAWYPVVYFSLWLKSHHYTVYQINSYPTPQNAINMISAFIGTAASGVYAPWKPYMVNVAGNAIFCLIMTIYHVPTGAVFFAFYIAGLIGAGSPVLYATINRVLKHDQEQKAIVTALTYATAMLVYLWAPLGLFPTAEKDGENAAPQWKKGYPTALAMAILMGVLFLLGEWLDKRDRIKRGDNLNPEEDVVTDDEFDEKDEIESEPDVDVSNEKDQNIIKTAETSSQH